MPIVCTERIVSCAASALCAALVVACLVGCEKVGAYSSRPSADEPLATDALTPGTPIRPQVVEVLRPVEADSPPGQPNDIAHFDDFVASEPVKPGNDASPEGEPPGRFREIMTSTWDDILHDYNNYYTRDTLGQFALVVAPAAVAANSDLDSEVRDWYQHHVRTYDTNRAANVLRPLGDGRFMVPGYIALKFLGESLPDRPLMPIVGDFGDRTTRAFLVGSLPLVAVQVLTGGGRPIENEDRSFWKPFQDSHGASGHAFIGALPWITAAQMTDDPWAKCFFYACSPWTGFSRINDDKHYLSQVWLGWWMAYLACEAVNKTEHGKQTLVVTPLCTPDMTGLGVIYQH